MFVWIMLQSLNFLISRLFRTRTSLTFSQLQSVYSLLNAHVIWQEHTYILHTHANYVCLLGNSNLFYKLRLSLKVAPVSLSYLAQTTFVSSTLLCLTHLLPKTNIFQNATLMLGLCWCWYIKLRKTKWNTKVNKLLAKNY